LHVARDFGPSLHRHELGVDLTRVDAVLADTAGAEPASRRLVAFDDTDSGRSAGQTSGLSLAQGNLYELFNARWLELSQLGRQLFRPWI
ncbi:MAG: hypothetical protein OEX13_21490, partial [Gammaproteobacteria bacterium]|nr:hypothetical protein [Gammaproteobacteria bacterium]